MTGPQTATPTGVSRADLQADTARVVDAAGTKVLLIRVGNEVRATSAWCTHARTLLGDQTAEDGLIECPMHGAVFDSLDGSLQVGPSCDALPVYEVLIDADGQILVHLPEHVAEEQGRARPVASWGDGWPRPNNTQREET